MQKNIWQKLKPPILALAPMAGYTDSAFRILCLENGADIVYTEMISVEAIWRKNEKTLKMLKLLPHPSKNCFAINGAREKNVILQLFGSKPESFVKALQVINKLQKAGGSFVSPKGLPQDKLVGLDINFGCPAKKVFNTGSGAALMNNKKLAREIIQTVLKNTKLPVSIKIRSQVKNVAAVEFINYIKDLPISAVMIHGRNLKQGFSGPIDYEMIRKVKKILPNIPVLANGGINNPQDAKIMLTKTGADGIGIARGSWGKPWIFREIPSFLRRGGTSPDEIGASDGVVNKSWLQIKKTMLRHAELFLKQQSCDKGVQVMKPAPGSLVPLRKHLIHYTKGQKNASQLRQKIIKVKTLDDLKKI